LKGTHVGVTAGLEARVQPYPGGPTVPNTAERRRGAAMAALARGSQGIYVFNYFDVGRNMPYLLKEIDSAENLKGKDRNYVVTYTDITVPSHRMPPALPKKIEPGQSAEFRLFIGPKPIAGARGETLLELAHGRTQRQRPLTVTVNNGPTMKCPPYRFSRGLFCAGYNTIRIANPSPVPVTVRRVELAVRFAQK